MIVTFYKPKRFASSMNINFLDFEQPIAELEAKIQELRMVGTDADINLSEEISRLESKCNDLIKTLPTVATLVPAALNDKVDKYELLS